jgi:adenine-specific DNA-methyltransferase
LSDLLENIHHVRELMDDVFGRANFVSLIHYTTAGGFTSATLSRAGDFLLWYAKDLPHIKYRRIFQTKKSPIGQGDSKYDQVELPGKIRRALSADEKLGEEELPKGARIFRYDTLVSAGFREKTTVDFEFNGNKYHPGPANNWKASVPDGMNRLAIAGRIAVTSKGKLVYVRYFDDFPAVSMTSMWSDVGGAVQSRSDPKVFVVQTGTSVIERCVLMTTDPGDLAFDPTCGSGTTAYVSEQWGRRWTFLLISFTAVLSSDSRRPVMNTCAPSSTNRLAVANPIPLVPPVTSPIFPSSLPIFYFSM